MSAPLRQTNLACRVDSAEPVVDFFTAAEGCHVRASHQGDHGLDFVQVEIGGTAINVFEKLLYDVEPPQTPSGWAHVSFETPSVDVFLADPVWASVLIWGPESIRGSFGARRIAFFEPAQGIRIEIMEAIDD